MHRIPFLYSSHVPTFREQPKQPHKCNDVSRHTYCRDQSNQFAWNWVLHIFLYLSPRHLQLTSCKVHKLKWNSNTVSLLALVPYAWPQVDFSKRTAFGFSLGRTRLQQRSIRGLRRFTQSVALLPHALQMPSQHQSIRTLMLIDYWNCSMVL